MGGPPLERSFTRRSEFAFGGKPESICSLRAVPLLPVADLGHRKARVVLGSPNWGVGRRGNSRLRSEQFRPVHRTRWPLCGRLSARPTDSGGGRSSMKRRKFITLLGGAAAAWPLAARAQPRERVWRVGVLTGIVEADAEGQARFSAFRNAMDQAGWIEGRNIQYEYRSRSGGNIERVRRNVAELLAVAPDAILVTGSLNLGALQQASDTVPTVFVGLIDPVGTGFVESLARPGGNTTGFTAFEYALSAKWVEILKELEPIVTRVGVMRERGTPTGVGLWAAMQGPASSIGMELRPIEVHDAVDIERGIAAMARVAGSGFVVTASGGTIQHRDLIAGLAARHRLPAVYPFRYFVTAGGLLSYGPDLNDQFRRAAGYINRILKGEKPADLPVQAPTKYELVISLKTAKALGLDLPSSVLARADEVIE